METLTRARKAVESGAFKVEIAPITITEKAEVTNDDADGLWREERDARELGTR